MYGGINRSGVGSFGPSFVYDQTMRTESGGNMGATFIKFEAAVSNAIFGGSTVQPYALQTMISIRF